MGQCCSKKYTLKKQNKDIDDRRMFKAAIDVMDKEFAVGIGYSRRANKKYTNVANVDNAVHQVPTASSALLQINEGTRSDDHEDQEIEDRRRQEAQT